MDEESVRASKVTSFATEQNIFDATNIPQLAFAIKSPDKNIQIPSQKHILDIVVNKPESIEAIYENDIVNILNKLLNDSQEGEILSNAIMNVIGLQSGVVDAVVRARAATEPLIQIIHSPNEKQSKQGSKALSDLVAENETIRSSLLTTGFAELVLHTLTSNNQIQSKSSSSSSDIIPIFIKVGLLDVVLRLVTTAEGLQPLSLLIPILEDLKQNGENELKNKSKKILTLLQSEGINFSPSQQNDEDLNKEKVENIRLREEIKQKVEEIRMKDEENKRKEEVNKRNDEEQIRKDEEIRKLKEELEKQKKEKERISNEFQKEKSGKERITEEFQRERNKKEKHIEENKKLKDEIEKMKQNEKSKDTSIPIEIINPDPLQINITDEDGTMKKINKNSTKNNVVSLSQVLEDGIYSIETQFINSEEAFIGVGVVENSYKILDDSRPDRSPHAEHMAAYGIGIENSFIWCKGKEIPGNSPIRDNKIVKAEYDSDKGTLFFFLDGIQQPNYITGIKEKVRFIV